MRAPLILATALIYFAGCSESGSSHLDASTQRDATGADVTSSDAAIEDASVHDAIALDADPIDSGEPDSGDRDAGLQDTGTTTTSTGGDVFWSPVHQNPTIVPENADDDFGGVAVDYFMQYTVVLPTPNVPAADLRITICSQRATATMPACVSRVESPAVEGDGGYRWGFDPSQYDVGLNRFWHILDLIQNGVVIDSARIDFRVTATF